MRKYDIQVERIRKAYLYLPGNAVNNFCGKPLRLEEVPHLSAAFSYQYTTAVALRYKSVKPQHFSIDEISNPANLALANKVHLARQLESNQQETQLKLEMNDGRELMESCKVPKGDIDANPMSRDEFITKFMRNAAYSERISCEKASQLLELLENIEQLETMDEVIALLTPETCI